LTCAPLTSSALELGPSVNVNVNVPLPLPEEAKEAGAMCLASPLPRLPAGTRTDVWEGQRAQAAEPPSTLGVGS